MVRHVPDAGIVHAVEAGREGACADSVGGGFSSVARPLSSVPEGISAPMRYARIGEILGLFDLHKLRLGCPPPGEQLTLKNRRLMPNF